MNNKNIMKGFTLLEVIIAITIIVVALVALLTLVVFTISSSSISASRLLAANLAQEGMELVRGIRDTNWLQPPDAWDYKISGTSGTPGEQAGTIDYDDIDQLTQYFSLPVDVETCGSNCQLYFQNGFYSHNPAGNPVPFYRLIRLYRPSAEQIEVVSQVKWIERGRSHTLETTSYLYEWQ